MPGIFINYRRNLDAAFAFRLYDHLSERFGPRRTFIVVDSIGLGEDFVDVLERTLKDTAVLLVLIGHDWLVCADERGTIRLHNPDDFVRLEVATALKQRGVRVIPVLIDGASLPSSDQLPDDLRSLVRRQAIEIKSPRFKTDVMPLVDALQRLLSTAETTAPEKVLAVERDVSENLAKKAEADRLAREAAKKAEADRLAREAAKKAEADRLAREAAKKAEADRLTREAAKKAEADRLTREAAKKAEADRLAREGAAGRPRFFSSQMQDLLAIDEARKSIPQPQPSHAAFATATARAQVPQPATVQATPASSPERVMSNAEIEKMLSTLLNALGIPELRSGQVLRAAEEDFNALWSVFVRIETAAREFGIASSDIRELRVGVAKLNTNYRAELAKWQALSTQERKLRPKPELPFWVTN